MVNAHGQQEDSKGITLLWVGGSSVYWKDSLNWQQINVPAGQTPVHRVPTELDDVVFSKTLSGLSDVSVSMNDIDPYSPNYPYLVVGRKDSTGRNCRSMHVSSTDFRIGPDGTDSGPILDVYSANGGHVIIDSGSTVNHIILNLHGGDSTVTDLTIDNSTVGQIFSHAVWCSIHLDSSAKTRLVGSTINTWGLSSEGGGNFFVKDCILHSPEVSLGDNSIDTFLNNKIYVDGSAFVGLTFFIGKNSHFVSSNVNIESFKDITFTTSGSVFNGNLKSDYPDGYIYLEQEDPLHQLPNIINGNLEVQENNDYFSIKGDLKISGNFICHSIADDYFNDTASIFVNGKYIFRIGGFPAYGNTDSIVGCDQGYCHFTIEFFGDSNSNILWPIGFPIDTLIVNKSNCANVTFANSLYVSGEAQIKKGQLRLEPNDTIPYKMVCKGDLKIDEGGGLFLAKDSTGKVANIAIGGSIYNSNLQADSSCSGFSNPYNGVLTMFNRNSGSGNDTLGITLLWVGGISGNWNDSLNWKQINIPTNQTALYRVPTGLDDVIFSKAMSGISAAKIYIPDSSSNDLNPTVIVGRKDETGPHCKSLHVSGTALTLPDGLAAATSIEVFTSAGGKVIIDSSSSIPHALFSLHGGDTSVTDLTIKNSSVGTLFSHANWGSMYVDSFAKVHLTSSTIGGISFGAGDEGRFYAKDCAFNCTSVSFGHYSVDSLTNCSFQNDGNNPIMSFLIGRDARFFSSNIDIVSHMQLYLTTSGSTLNGNLTTYTQGSDLSISLDQEDPLHPLPNIINGNIEMGENDRFPIRGDLKLSGNLTSNTSPLVLYSDTAGIKVNNKKIFVIGGITNYGGTDTITNAQHFSIEFFGNNNSNIFWPIGFPADTLIVNKANCAKVTFTNPLYVSGEARIQSGQLVLIPNDSIDYKMVCRGDVNIARGGGIFLGKDSKSNVANIAIEGAIHDSNAHADSTCSGFSNPYNGLVTFFIDSSHVADTTVIADTTAVKFAVDFSGEYLNKSVTLKWNTENELHTKNFSIEKMNVQNVFTSIATVPASRQLSNSYQFIDAGGLLPNNYYRLKIYNLDGSFSYSNIVAISAPATSLRLYPNPVKDKLFLWLPQLASEASLTIIDAKGTQVKSLTLNAGVINATVNIATLLRGIYIAILKTSGWKQVVKFVKE